MNKVIKGVRIHDQPRQKLYDLKRHNKFNRRTVMLTNEGKPHVKDDGLQRDNGQMKDQWCGLTIFYHDKPNYDETPTTPACTGDSKTKKESHLQEKF